MGTLAKMENGSSEVEWHPKPWNRNIHNDKEEETQWEREYEWALGNSVCFQEDRVNPGRRE